MSSFEFVLEYDFFPFLTSAQPNVGDSLYSVAAALADDFCHSFSPNTPISSVLLGHNAYSELFRQFDNLAIVAAASGFCFIYRLVPRGCSDCGDCDD